MRRRIIIAGFAWVWIVLQVTPPLAPPLIAGGNITESQLTAEDDQTTPYPPGAEGRKSEIQNPSQRVVRAVRTDSPKIDGVFEAEWLKAEPADQFVQRRPVEGAPATLATQVYLLYDDDALNVCFVCHDPAPDSIAARVQRRDRDENCDEVNVYLDSFHDRRNGYYFFVTAAGGQLDGVISNEVEFNDTWDGIWESAVGRTDSGWIAEMRLPFSSFRHGGAREDGWGINFRRWINRRQEGDFWQFVPVQRAMHVGEFGQLTGLENLGSAGHLELLPHVVARFDAPIDSHWKSKSEWEDIGFYAKYVPASTWTMDFAYQPDFAQVDVDDEVINLSDYPVFLTEKRPFFLEVGSFFETSPIQLLYTRRITDPDFGGRIYGQSEKFRYMVLGGQNRTPDGRGQAVGAGRAVWNVGKQNSVGLTSTGLYQESRLKSDALGQHYLPGYFYASATGLDSRVRWGAENRWSLSAVGVARSAEYWTGFDAVEGEHHKYDLQPFEFRSGLYQDLKPLPVKLSLNNAYRGQDYNINDLGWSSYSNVIEHTLWFGNNWQVTKGFLREWGLGLNGWQRNMPDGRFGQGGGNWDSWFIASSYDEFGAGWEWGNSGRRRYTDSATVGEFRDNFFEQYGRFDIEPHYYNSGWLWFFSDRRRWLTFSTESSYGLFREGHKWMWNNGLEVKPRANLETGLAVDWTRVWGVSDYNYYQPTTFRVWRWRTRYSPTSNLSFRGTLQLVEDAMADSAGNYTRDELLTNLLFAWNWRPGSWFYIVYDEGLRIAEPLAYRNEGDRKIQVKGTYFFTVK